MKNDSRICNDNVEGEKGKNAGEMEEKGERGRRERERDKEKQKKREEEIENTNESIRMMTREYAMIV